MMKVKTNVGTKYYEDIDLMELAHYGVEGLWYWQY
jgi:hypothetical protein